jgi:glycine/D-amino acid oxidase-like deaminating enzyme
MADGADVVVVGGGIIGCSAALALARRGATVTLLERAEVAAGASGRNHGLLLRPLEPELGPMAEATARSYEAVVAEAPFGLPLDPGPIGFLIVPLDEGEADAARAEAEAARAVGVAVDALDEPALRREEPGLAAEASEGWLLADGRRTDPAALTSAHAILAARAGAAVRPGVVVRRVVEAGGGRSAAVVTDAGTISAGTVVVAAGPWSRALLGGVGVHLPLTGARGWLVHLAPASPPLRHLVSRAGWHLLPGPEPAAPIRADTVARGGWPEAVVGSLLQPNPDGTVLAGASRQPVVTPEPEDPEVPVRIVREAVRLLPALAAADLISAWWGVRPMTPDGLPAIGRVAEGILVATGHGSQGVILGGGTAALVAALALAEPPPFDPAPFAPDRFDPRGPAERAPARTMEP